jgi:glucose-1-phosphate thymidylyltransferase
MGMKAIVLAGGHGTRLYPNTAAVTKQLLPIYDKPIIYYPISVLMLCGVKEILIISTPHDLPHIEKLLGNGERLGVKFSYMKQEQPEGISQAFTLGEDFIGDNDVALILGDNLFHGNLDVFRKAFKNQLEKSDGSYARVFAYQVSDPQRYGIVEFKNGKVISIEEKPKVPKSPYAIPGLYLFSNDVAKRVKVQKPSNRGELEITDTIQTYLDEGKLSVETIPRGMAWLDTGTPQSMLEASSYIYAIEQRQGLKVACLEEIAYRMGFINKSQLEKTIEDIPNCEYRDYVQTIVRELAQR